MAGLTPAIVLNDADEIDERQRKTPQEGRPAGTAQHNAFTACRRWPQHPELSAKPAPVLRPGETIVLGKSAHPSELRRDSTRLFSALHSPECANRNRSPMVTGVSESDNTTLALW